MADQLSSNLAALRIDRGQKPARRGRSWRPVVVVVLLGIASVGAYRLGAPYLESKIFKTEVALTEIALVSPAQASVELTSSGYVVPQSVSQVGAKIGGKVAKVYVKQGSRVNAGDVLFEIDAADQQASIATARSQAAAARARAAAAEASVTEIAVQAKRATALAREGVAPQGNADDLDARIEALKEQVKATRAEAAAAGSLVSALSVNLESFTVRAPIAGTVVNKPPEVGEFVGPQPAGVSVDMGGVEIADFSSLMVETDVPEQRLSLVKIGGPCEIVLDAYPDRRYRGKALEVTPKVDRAKATVTVKVDFVDDRDGALPDMSARVSFLNEALDADAIKAPPKVVVPQDAVAKINGGNVVYVVEDGKVRITPVELGPAFGSGFELSRGPKPGTRVVSGPPPGLSDGQAIKERDRS